jgi:hypothetical protein
MKCCSCKTSDATHKLRAEDQKNVIFLVCKICYDLFISQFQREVHTNGA